MYQPAAFNPTAVSGHSPEAAARAMLAQHWDGRLPVDPVEIARNVGLDVHYTSPFEPGYENWSGYFSASARQIQVNGMDPPVRQRFTIAHELGHFALNHGAAFRDGPAELSSGTYKPKEREANQFAAELLMPMEVVRRVVQSGTVADVEQLASIFNVSKVAMTYRVSNLGLPI